MGPSKAAAQTAWQEDSNIQRSQMPKHKTTTKDYATFKETIVKWMRTFGLTDWQLETQHKEIPDHESGSAACAITNFDISARSVLFTLNTTWLRPAPSLEIEAVAFHEVVHLLLAPLTSEATNRYTTHDVLESIEESIVVRLENAFMSTTLSFRPQN
jgi:hypothetical protein